MWPFKKKKEIEYREVDWSKVKTVDELRTIIEFVWKRMYIEEGYERIEEVRHLLK